MKRKNLHLLLGWLLLSLFTLALFPDQELALKAETPLLGQTSPRTIIAPLSFDVLKNPQALEAEKQKAMDKVQGILNQLMQAAQAAGAQAGAGAQQQQGSSAGKKDDEGPMDADYEVVDDKK